MLIKHFLEVLPQRLEDAVLLITAMGLQHLEVLVAMEHPQQAPCEETPKAVSSLLHFGVVLEFMQNTLSMLFTLICTSQVPLFCSQEQGTPTAN